MIATTPYVRLMIRADLPACMRLEFGQREGAWTQEDWLTHCRKPNAMSYVVEDRCGLLGFLILAINADHVEILNFCILRGLGLGRILFENVKGHLSPDRNRVTVILPESELSAQKGFRSAGFLAKAVLRKHFAETGEDGYLMEWRT